MDTVLGLRAFDLGRVLEMDPAFFQQKGTLFSVSREQRRHDTTVVSVGFERAGELHMERTNAWIGKLLQVWGGLPLRDCHYLRHLLLLHRLRLITSPASSACRRRAPTSSG